MPRASPTPTIAKVPRNRKKVENALRREWGGRDCCLPMLLSIEESAAKLGAVQGPKPKDRNASTFDLRSSLLAPRSSLRLGRRRDPVDFFGPPEAGGVI